MIKIYRQEESNYFSTKKVEVFKTNVTEMVQANEIIVLLLQYFPGNRINFDLDDCDRILRIEGDDFCPTQIMFLVKEKGFDCSILN